MGKNNLYFSSNIDWQWCELLCLTTVQINGFIFGNSYCCQSYEMKNKNKNILKRYVWTLFTAICIEDGSSHGFSINKEICEFGTDFAIQCELSQDDIKFTVKKIISFCTPQFQL